MLVFHCLIVIFAFFVAIIVSSIFTMLTTNEEYRD